MHWGGYYAGPLAGVTCHIAKRQVGNVTDDVYYITCKLCTRKIFGRNHIPVLDEEIT